LHGCCFEYEEWQVTTPLEELMRCIEQVSSPLCASQLARTLNRPAEVVEGMLSTLAAMGRIARLEDSQACRWCPLRSGCSRLPAEERFYYNPHVASP